MNARRSAWLLIGLGLFMALGATLVSCAPDTTAPTLQTQLTAAPDADAAQPTVVAMNDEAREDQACLDCHTNQELLVELAVEEEVVSLNSGPG